MKLLSGDAVHGDTNKKIMAGWLQKYVPLCVDAAGQLQPVWDLQRNGELNYASVAAEAKHRFKDILTEIGIGLPVGVAL